jgi:hypothetical protein
MKSLLFKAMILTAAAVASGQHRCFATPAIQVNLADGTGPTVHGPAGGVGTVWNAWQPVATSLRDAAGAATPVSITAAGNGPYGDWWCDLELLAGGIYQDGPTALPVAVTGLAPGHRYDVYLASAYGRKAVATAFHCANPTASPTDQTADNRTSGNASTWVRGENFVLFQSVVADANGEIHLTYQGIAGYGILNGCQLVETSAAAFSFAAWAAMPAQGLTSGVDDGPLDDPDGDGIVNLLEFSLSGQPRLSSSEILPRLSNNTSGWVFGYDRSESSRPPDTTQVVEYSANWVTWIPIPIPAVSSGNVTITTHGNSAQVRVLIPIQGPRMFARLKVSR